MSTHHTSYFTQLYRAVLESKSIEEAPLATAERIHLAINSYLKSDCQRPSPLPHEV
jgi:hypothetical protein